MRIVLQYKLPEINHRSNDSTQPLSQTSAGARRVTVATRLLALGRWTLELQSGEDLIYDVGLVLGRRNSKSGRVCRLETEYIILMEGLGARVRPIKTGNAVPNVIPELGPSAPCASKPTSQA